MNGLLQNLLKLCDAVKTAWNKIMEMFLTQNLAEFLSGKMQGVREVKSCLFA